MKNDNKNETSNVETKKTTPSTQTENPMKNVQTKALPTKTIYFSEQKKTKEDGHSS